MPRHQDIVFEVLNAIRDQRTDVGELKDYLVEAPVSILFATFYAAFDSPLCALYLK